MLESQQSAASFPQPQSSGTHYLITHATKLSIIISLQHLFCFKFEFTRSVRSLLAMFIKRSKTLFALSVFLHLQGTSHYFKQLLFLHPGIQYEKYAFVSKHLPPWSLGHSQIVGSLRSHRTSCSGSYLRAVFIQHTVYGCQAASLSSPQVPFLVGMASVLIE